MKALNILADIVALPVFLPVMLVVWLTDRFCRVSTDQLIEREFIATKQRINDMAGQSWRNLVI